MNKMKKVISAGMSAALVASLFTFIAAGSVSAAVTVTSAGNIPQGGSSAGTATFRITEQAAGSLPNSAGSIDIVITDSASAATVGFSGTPVVSAPGSLGASAAIVGGTLTFSWSASDTANIEYIDVSGLTIDDLGGAALGAVKATLTNPTGAGVAIADFQAGGTASGTISAGIGIGATSVIVNVTTPSCIFVSAGTLDFATSAESVALTTASAINTPAIGQQTLTIGATASVHNAGEVVSESTACAPSGVLASPGTVVAALTFLKPTNATVFAGENNSPANNLVLIEPSFGFLAAGTTFTYTIATAGVVFSTAPSVSDVNNSDSLANAMVLSAPVLAADRKSATVNVTTASTITPARITLSNIKYDVASTVAGGTFISVGVTTSAGKAVLPPSRTNAVVFRGILAVSATNPTVYIGENSQAAGIISFTENAAGFFTDGTGSNNTFEICPAGVNYDFTLAPYAKVTGGVAAGNLILRDGAGPSTTNLVKGVQAGDCYFWTVWTKSTTASTIQIGNADLTTGPVINVNVAQAPGPVLVDLFIGSSAIDDQLAATVQFATAAYRNQVSVTALSQPSIRPGSNNAAGGNVQIAETALGQLKAGEDICVQVLYRTFGNQDTFMNSLLTANLPVATSSGTGLVIGPVNGSEKDCFGVDDSAIPGAYMQSFSFRVLQQSTAGDGKVVISNINYTTLADAVEGPVQLSVYGFGGSPTSVIFHSTVSNARIASNAIAGTAATRLGVTQTGAFTTSTKVQKVGKYVTYRFDFGVAAAGQHVDIWGATKTGNDWSAFAKVTGRVANASGVVYYYIRQGSATWKSYRATVTGSGTLTPARQARWIP